MPPLAPNATRRFVERGTRIMKHASNSSGADVRDIPIGRDLDLAFLDLSIAACPLVEVLAWSVRVWCEALSVGKRFVDAVVLTGGSRAAFDALPGCYVSPGLRNLTHLGDRAAFDTLRLAVGGKTTADGHHAVINRYFADTGNIPRLAAPPATRIWAEGFLKSYNPRSLVVTVQAGPGSEKAAFEAFLEAARNRHPETLFLVLGPEEGWSARTRRRSDIIFLERLGLGLLERLALLQAGDGFFGMPGGPAGMACFSDLPYVLFLPPETAARSARALDVSPGTPALPFAGPGQRLCWESADADTLLGIFAETMAFPGETALPGTGGDREDR